MQGLFLLTLIIATVYIGNSYPQKLNPKSFGNKIEQNCKLRYETKFEIQEVENERTQCDDIVEKKCSSKTRPNCHLKQENRCNTQYKQECYEYKDQVCNDVWKNKCEIRHKEVCKLVVNEISVPFVEEKCAVKQERRCTKHWEEIENGRKVWVDNPSTCKFYDVTDCKPVTKERRELKRENICNQIPFQHCDRIMDQQCHFEPKQSCKDVPYQNCNNFVIEVCDDEYYEDCDYIPTQKCRVIHEKLPKQVTVQVPIQDCSNGIDNGFDIPFKIDLNTILSQQPIETKAVQSDDSVIFDKKKPIEDKRLKEATKNDRVIFNKA